MYRHASINRSYRLVWSHARQMWLAVAETTRGQRKGRGRRAASSLAATLLLTAGPSFAELPSGGHISAGSGAIDSNGSEMVVTQSSERMAADWQSFSIGKDNSVTFEQPSSSAVALNRVTGSDLSTIQGALRANGQVFLINPNGVLFSPTAQVEVGGLVASTLELSDEDFLDGNYRFEGDSSAAITNQGSIEAAEGQAVVLIAAKIINEGSIDAPKGSVLMGSGSRVTLDLGGPVQLSVDKGALDSLIEQGGAVRADGGRVYMTAKAADHLATSVINHSGITRAQTLATGEEGEIILLGDMDHGTTEVAGTLDASAPNVGDGDGGFIETSAAQVKVADDTTVTTLSETGESGTWLIDPTDYTIAASGGDISGATLSTNLAGGNVEIQSSGGATAGSGDINVNDDVTWSTNTLTLTAARDININAVMTANDSAALTLNTATANGSDAAVTGGSVNVALGGNGFTGRVDFFQADGTTPRGGTGFLTINTRGYTVITALGAAGSTTGTDLQGMAGGLAGHYALGADIDATATADWNSLEGFTPIGGDPFGSTPFTGSFNGLGHTIDKLTSHYIDKYKGLFGITDTTATISNVGLTGAVMTSDDGGYYVGILAGRNNGTISHSFASGTVGTYSLDTTIGGLVGDNSGSGTISHSYASSTVSGRVQIGGLVGDNSGTINSSYATGTVAVSSLLGGGLVGVNSGTISNSYASGAVSNLETGGLVGDNSGTISNSYATGLSDDRGLVFSNSGTISNSFWDVETSGQTLSSGGTGLTTAEMQTLTTFTTAGWDIDNAGDSGTVWRLYDGHSYPLLRGLLTPLTVQPAFDGSATAMSDIGAIAAGAYDAGKVFGTAETLVLSSSADDTYTATLEGGDVYSTGQDGYDIILGSRYIATPGSAAGNIVLDNPISWDSGTLAIDTSGTISGNAAISGAAGTAFALRDGSWSQVAATLPAFSVTDFRFNGGNFLRALGGDGSSSNPYQLTDIYGVQGMAGSAMLDQNYQLANDIDASTTANWNSDGSGGFYAFQPIGDGTTPFSGSLDGLGHTIDKLTIDRPAIDDVGLFGATSTSSTVTHLGLTEAAITAGTYYAGTLAGQNHGTISDSYASGTVTGNSYVGGLVGYNPGTIRNSYASGTVQGDWNTGGLVGENDGTISDSYASGTVAGATNVGGLVGGNQNTISNSYATGAVTGNSYVGGLVGEHPSGTTSNSFWDTDTSGQTTSASGSGLTTAQMQSLATFTNAGWDIDAAGGTGTLWRIYAGNSYPLLRGFLTDLTVTATNDSKTYDGLAYSGGNGVTLSDPAAVLLGTASYGGTAQGAANAGSYTLSAGGLYSNQQGYDITFANGQLTIDKAPLTVTAINASKTYDGIAYNGGNGVIYSGFVGSEDEGILGGALSYSGNSQGAVSVGTYIITPGGLSSSNYTLSYVDGRLAIQNPPTVTTPPSDSPPPVVEEPDGTPPPVTGNGTDDTLPSADGSIPPGDDIGSDVPTTLDTDIANGDKPGEGATSGDTPDNDSGTPGENGSAPTTLTQAAITSQISQAQQFGQNLQWHRGGNLEMPQVEEKQASTPQHGLGLHIVGSGIRLPK